MKKMFVGVFALLGISLASLAPQPALAINVFDQCANNADSAVCKSTGDQAPDMVKIVINILLTVLGMIAVIMIVVGGIRYTTSNGNASQVKEAKDTILYAVVGLVVAIMSFSIVNFVLGRFSGP
jgi:hypothetical protein